MQTKLTLGLDDRPIRNARYYARKSGKPLSQMVAEYFSCLETIGDYPREGRGRIPPGPSSPALRRCQAQREIPRDPRRIVSIR